MYRGGGSGGETATRYTFRAPYFSRRFMLWGGAVFDFGSKKLKNVSREPPLKNDWVFTNCGWSLYQLLVFLKVFGNGDGGDE